MAFSQNNRVNVTNLKTLHVTVIIRYCESKMLSFAILDYLPDVFGYNTALCSKIAAKILNLDLLNCFG